METDSKKESIVEIDNMTIYVTSTYRGEVSLEDLVKRLIQKDIEYANDSSMSNHRYE